FSRTVELGAEGAWFKPTSTPHPGSQEEHLEMSWQCLPSISSEDMPKSFTAERFTPVMRNSGSYRTSASESWSKTDSNTAVLCQPGVSFDIRSDVMLGTIITGALPAQIGPGISSRGATPPT